MWLLQEAKIGAGCVLQEETRAEAPDWRSKGVAVQQGGRDGTWLDMPMQDAQLNLDIAWNTYLPNCRRGRLADGFHGRREGRASSQQRSAEWSIAQISGITFVEVVIFSCFIIWCSKNICALIYRYFYSVGFVLFSLCLSRIFLEKNAKNPKIWRVI